MASIFAWPAVSKHAENSVTIGLLSCCGTGAWVRLHEQRRHDRDNGTDLHEESPRRMLEGGDRTVGVGEGGLEMCKNLRRRSARFGGPIWRRATSRQCRAELALAQVEPFPDALPGSVASPAVGNDAACRGDADGDGALQESPHSVGGQAQPPDLVGNPDAEGSTAAAAALAVAAKDPPSADGLALRVALVVAAQKAVANQRAHRFAMRTCCLLESFSNRVPFRLGTAKPPLLAHVHSMPRENR
jgi:hypothetical protein